ncbi:subtilin biosynthesis protein spaC [Streptomyces sp. A7024]|uniref:Subtilin biosynthesis protein spaC n=1 Tax=Streptomyces coryli TaxID=1128680 RepID=A0A6G4TTM1_9ACTN|nr:lanthionine synthetase LanC family protein [Streptomyces coryli]NGN62448.1 subtilin biosynthesis protein spaC [Streptomyces coryli]
MSPVSAQQAAAPAAVYDTAHHVLTAFARAIGADERGAEYSIDFGPAVLAALVGQDHPHADSGLGPPAEPGPEASAFVAWLRTLREGCTHPGLFGWGLAGYLQGLNTARPVWPAVAGLADAARAELSDCAHRWRPDRMGWLDYDVVTGPAGSLLVLAADPRSAPRDLTATTGHLTRLCDTPELTALRVGRYRGEDLRGFNYGRINTGIAHGAAGVALALAAAARATGLTADLGTALTRLATWLRGESRIAPGGLITWPHAGGVAELPRGPQAWCYGTPGVAWALWETAGVLGDAELADFALDAAASVLRWYDSGDTAAPLGLTLCHGAPGLALLCDAFDRYAALPGAGPLRDRLVSELLGRQDEVIALADEDTTLLSGASGACAALLTLYGGDRGWLSAFGLR